MSAFPGGPSEDRRPLPPFAPAVSRPAAGAPGSEPRAGAPLPPFMPFSRPAERPAAPVPPALEPPVPVAAESAASPEEQPMPWDDAPTAGLVPESTPPAPGVEEEDLPWLVSDAPEPAAEPSAAAAGEAAPAASAPSSAAEEELPAWLDFMDSDEDEAPAAAAEPEVVSWSPGPRPDAEPWAAPAGAGFGAPEPAPAMEPWADEPSAAPAESSFAAEPFAGGALGEEAFAAEESFALAEDRGGFAEPTDGARHAAESAPGLEDYLAGSDATAAEEALYGSAEGAREDDARSAPAGGAMPAAGALAEVAERLEGIARALRERPEEVLAGGAGRDPLELLVAGFVLGYAQGRGRGIG